MVNTVDIHNVSVSFGSGEREVHALRSVNLSLKENETLGLVGESGSGKSTLAKVLVGMYRLSAGRVKISDHEITPENRGMLKEKSILQMVPQDPYSSLSPRRTAGQTIAESIDPRKPDVSRYCDEISSWLKRVGLDVEAIDKYPYQFSGGQRQRIAIARALCVNPAVLIADEITSALDLSVQAEILSLLDSLRGEMNLSMIFISHNLGVVKHISDRVAVLYHGQLVEVNDTNTVFHSPGHDYTRKLLNSIPGSPGFNIRPDRLPGSG